MDRPLAPWHVADERAHRPLSVIPPTPAHGSPREPPIRSSPGALTHGREFTCIPKPRRGFCDLKAACLGHRNRAPYGI